MFSPLCQILQKHCIYIFYEDFETKSYFEKKWYINLIKSLAKKP